MARVPREYFNALLGRGDTFGGLVRAAIAGLLLDMCSHGILMIGAKMYERGASLARNKAARARIGPRNSNRMANMMAVRRLSDMG